jgi:hypothetical protein
VSAVTAETVPNVEPVTADATTSTGETGVKENETPSELAVMFVVTNPTGSVVAVTFCALASGRAARTAAAARVSDVDFNLMELDDLWFGVWK